MPGTTGNTDVIYTEETGMERTGEGFFLTAEELTCISLEIGEHAYSLLKDWKGSAAEAFGIMTEQLMGSMTGTGTRYKEMSELMTVTGRVRTEIDISAADKAKGE